MHPSTHGRERQTDNEPDFTRCTHPDRQMERQLLRRTKKLTKHNTATHPPLRFNRPKTSGKRFHITILSYPRGPFRVYAHCCRDNQEDITQPLDAHTHPQPKQPARQPRIWRKLLPENPPPVLPPPPKPPPPPPAAEPNPPPPWLANPAKPPPAAGAAAAAPKDGVDPEANALKPPACGVTPTAGLREEGSSTASGFPARERALERRGAAACAAPGPTALVPSPIDSFTIFAHKTLHPRCSQQKRDGAMRFH